MRWPWVNEADEERSVPPLEQAGSAAQGNGSASVRDAPPASAPEQAPAAGFIGRRKERDLFAELLDGVAAGRSCFVHVSGTARSGRRALLEEFRVMAGRTAGRTAPVVDFEVDAAVDLDELLERIAVGLEPEADHFKRFLEATKRFRSREAGQPTRTSQAVAVIRAGSSAVTQIAGALPVKAVNAAIQSPIGDVLTEHAETRRTLSAVSDDFVSGLLGLAAAGGPVLLVFANLDCAASNAKLLWLRRSLLPRVARSRVIVAVSTDQRFDLDDVGMLFGRMEQVRLDRFEQAEAEEFLVGHIHLAKDSPLGRAVLTDSDGFPQRLAGYAEYFNQHPEARAASQLPTEARDLTAGDLASGLLSRIDDPFLRAVLLHAAPLRWFNAELLARIETICELTPAAGGPHAAGLLDLGVRPSWVTNVGGGWGIDLDARRRAIVDEFRRLHPGLYRQVHLHAAAYHVTRLRELEGARRESAGGGPVGEKQVFDYAPLTHPTDRLRWDEYLVSLGEWLYHLVALAPRRGFARLADYVGEALAWGYPAVATALLDIGVEIALPASESLARQRMLEVARALHNDRHAETLQLLGEFAAAGSASTIADAAASFLVGTRLMLLGRSPLSLYENFERAEKLLGRAGTGVQASSLRCLNLTRLARDRARREGGAEAALELLTQATELARPLDPRVQAEVKRTLGLILAGADKLDEALAACDEALEVLNRAGAAAEAALVLGLRAEVNLKSDRRDAARRDLTSARSIYRQLVDPEAEAQVVLGLLDIAVRDRDENEAAAHEAAIALLRPDDFLLRNQIGNLYFQAERHAEAVARYSDALAISPEPAMFANRGRARQRWADQIDAGAGVAPGAAPADGAAGAEGLRRLARDDLTQAFDQDPDDLDAGIDRAELERQLGDGAAAAATAERVARRAVAAALALPRSASGSRADGGERAAIVRRLRDLAVRALTLLGPKPTAEILEAWMGGLPDDEELELMRAIAGHELGAANGGGLDQAIAAAERAVAAADPPRGRALVELAALHARARNWREAKEAAESAIQDEMVRVQAEYMLDRLDQLHRREDEFGGEPETLVEELVLDIAEELQPWFDPGSPVGSEFFAWMIEAFRRGREERVGLPAPGLWVGVRKELHPGTVQVVVDNVIRARHSIEADLLAAAAPEDCRRRAGVDGRPGVRPWDGAPATWLPGSAAAALEEAGIDFWDPRGLVLAALDAALEAHPRFVSVEEAAKLSGEAWGPLPATEFIARGEIIRALLEARVPPGALPPILHDYRAAEEERRGEVIADAVARLAVPRKTAESLAARFEFTAFKQPAGGGAGGGRRPVEVLVRHAAEGPADAVAEAGRRVIEELSEALQVPAPELRVEHDESLAAGTVAVSVGGITRMVARPTDALDWWRCHPVAGRAGRTGTAGPDLAGTVVRAIEEVLWNDPALLLPDVATDPEAAKEALAGLLGTPPSERLTMALLEVLGRRVPLGPPAKLRRAREHVLDRSQSGRLRLPAARTFPSSPGRPVPDNLPFGIRDTIHVDEQGKLRQLAVRVQLHHDEDSDLRVSLRSPSGKTVVLHDRGDDLGHLRTGVDEDHVPAMAALRNEHAEGDWTLHVQDLTSSDAGLLEEWAIELTTKTSRPGEAEPSARPTMSLSQAEWGALTRCASLERDLRTRRIEAFCGPALWASLEPEKLGGRLQEERVRLGTHLARELGLRFGHSIHFTPAPDLPEHGFRILVNGLVRSSGELGSGRYGQVRATAEATDADLWVGPLSGVTHRRLDQGAVGGFDEPERLMRHVRAAVREAAAEFADADWATAFLDRLAHTYHVTVPAVRTAAGDDLLAAVLRELVTLGVAVADPRLMELVRELVRSPERAGECQALAAAHPDHLGRTAGAMAEWLRERLDHRDPDPGVPIVELGPEIEAAVRAAVGSSGGRVPVYALSSAASILDQLEEVRVREGATALAVVTAASLRRHVHRLISAQFPTADVIARERLGDAVEREVIDLPAAAAPEPAPAG